MSAKRRIELLECSQTIGKKQRGVGPIAMNGIELLMQHGAATRFSERLFANTMPFD
jgi:hypothetical protein